jgi:hypothetical protein
MTGQWASVPTTRMIAITTVLHGRFLEVAFLALADDTRSDREVWAMLSGPRPPRKTDDELADIIRRSPRASELVGELNDNLAHIALLSRELTMRAVRKNPATGGLFVANSKSPRIEPKLAIEFAEAGLGINHLSDFEQRDDPRDLRHEAMAGAINAFNQQAKDALSATLATPWPAPDAVPPAVKDLRPRVEPPATRARIYHYAYICVSGLGQIFAPNPQFLPNAAWWAWRGELDRRKAQKRSSLVQDRRADLDALPDDRGPEVEALEAQRQKDDDLDVAHYYRIAKKRWGAAGQRFLDGYRATGSVTEAAESAGISRKTGQKYFAEFRKQPRRPR